MSDAPVLFLDFDDTLSDYARLGRQYVGNVAAHLAQEFGGDAAEWLPVVQSELPASLARYIDTFSGGQLHGVNTWLAEERRRVVEAIFAGAGRTYPDGDPVALAVQVQCAALNGCCAVFPGAEAALRTLQEAGIEVMMASSQPSDYLRPALESAGLAPYITRFFGPDLVDCAKEGPEFYRRLFAACGIRPSQAVVVDDQVQCLDWAEEAGGRVVQACLLPNAAEPEFPVVLRNLADLPKLLRMGLV